MSILWKNYNLIQEYMPYNPALNRIFKMLHFVQHFANRLALRCALNKWPNCSEAKMETAISAEYFYNFRLKR